jgi:hypothetical protein
MSGASFVGGARVHSPQNFASAIPRRQIVVITRMLELGGLCTKAWKDGAIPSPHLVPPPEGEETLEQALGARRREQSLDRFTHRVRRLKGPLLPEEGQGEGMSVRFDGAFVQSRSGESSLATDAIVAGL